MRKRFSLAQSEHWNTWSGDPRASSEDQMLIDQLGGSPQMVFSIPLTVRGKVVAVLYADSTSSDSQAINLDALEILVRVAAMAVNLVSVHRAAPEPRPETTAVRTEPATERAAEVESTYAPQVEAQVAEPESQPAPVETAEVSAPVEVTPEEIPATEAIAEEPPEQLAAEPAAAVEPSAPQAPPEPETIRKPADSVWSESVLQSSTPPPAFVSEYATPLGSARRFGVSEPDLPIEVSEEERRLHNDARRFARLLVSEIKLYNEPKVKEGRSHSDLYDRLREDIDRSRQMYDKRVAPPVAARHDYFHQELVNMLAEGDPAKLMAAVIREPSALINRNLNEMKTATLAVAVFAWAKIRIKNAASGIAPTKNVTRRLWRSEPLSIFGRCQEGLNHLRANVIAVKLIELDQPEIVTRVI